MQMKEILEIAKFRLFVWIKVYTDTIPQKDL